MTAENSFTCSSCGWEGTEPIEGHTHEAALLDSFNEDNILPSGTVHLLCPECKKIVGARTGEDFELVKLVTSFYVKAMIVFVLFMYVIGIFP